MLPHLDRKCKKSSSLQSHKLGEKKNHYSFYDNSQLKSGYLKRSQMMRWAVAVLLFIQSGGDEVQYQSYSYDEKNWVTFKVFGQKGTAEISFTTKDKWESGSAKIVEEDISGMFLVNPTRYKAPKGIKEVRKGTLATCSWDTDGQERHVDITLLGRERWDQGYGTTCPAASDFLEKFIKTNGPKKMFGFLKNRM